MSENEDLFESTLPLGGSTLFWKEDKRTVIYTFLLRGRTIFIKYNSLSFAIIATVRKSQVKKIYKFFV
jgi:hypothetical protein